MYTRLRAFYNYTGFKNDAMQFCRIKMNPNASNYSYSYKFAMRAEPRHSSGQHAAPLLLRFNPLIIKTISQSGNETLCRHEITMPFIGDETNTRNFLLVHYSRRLIFRTPYFPNLPEYPDSAMALSRASWGQIITVTDI